MRKTLIDIDHFIDPPSGAIELPDEALTQEFYPFLTRDRGFPKYNTDKDVPPGIIRDIWTLEHLPGGRLRKVKNSMVIIYGSSRKVAGVLPIKDGDPSDDTLYRLQDGFIEIGMQSGPAVYWRRKLKLGAKKGDTWNSSLKSDRQDLRTVDDTSKCRVKTIFLFGLSG
jgi:hypothetical protein